MILLRRKLKRRQKTRVTAAVILKAVTRPQTAPTPPALHPTAATLTPLHPLHPPLPHPQRAPTQIAAATQTRVHQRRRKRRNNMEHSTNVSQDGQSFQLFFSCSCVVTKKCYADNLVYYLFTVVFGHIHFVSPYLMQCCSFRQRTQKKCCCPSTEIFISQTLGLMHNATLPIFTFHKDHVSVGSIWKTTVDK